VGVLGGLGAGIGGAVGVVVGLLGLAAAIATVVALHRRRTPSGDGPACGDAAGCQCQAADVVQAGSGQDG